MLSVIRKNNINAEEDKSPGDIIHLISIELKKQEDQMVRRSEQNAHYRAQGRQALSLYFCSFGNF